MSAPVPPLRVDPGWYWWLIMPQDQKAWAEFRAANRAPAIVVRKVMRGQNETNEIVVFQVKQPIAWTLPVPPMKAPKGAQTNVSDLISGPPPSPHWTVALQEFMDIPLKPFRAVGEATKQTTNALTLLVWGGAAVLLFNLYQGSRVRRAELEASAEDAA